MEWLVVFEDEFLATDFPALPSDVRIELLAHLQVLRQIGPTLGRPKVDTLKGSKHKNLKELRFNVGDGVWRFAFAFDRHRNAVVLVGGDKGGLSAGKQKKFYGNLIETADERFDAYLAKTTKGTKK